MKKLIPLFIFLFTIGAKAQFPPDAPVVQLVYQNGILTYDIDFGETAAEVILYNWKYYMNINQMGPAAYNVVLNNQRASCWSINSDDKKPWRCMLEVPVMALGSNVLQVTYTANGVESPKSNPIVFYNSVNTQSIVNFKINECKPGTYFVKRITLANDLQPYFNSLVNHVAFSYATSNAIYVVSCDSE